MQRHTFPAFIGIAVLFYMYLPSTFSQDKNTESTKKRDDKSGIPTRAEFDALALKVIHLEAAEKRDINIIRDLHAEIHESVHYKRLRLKPGGGAGWFQDDGVGDTYYYELRENEIVQGVWYSTDDIANSHLFAGLKIVAHIAGEHKIEFYFRNAEGNPLKDIPGSVSVYVAYTMK